MPAPPPHMRGGEKEERVKRTTADESSEIRSYLEERRQRTCDPSSLTPAALYFTSKQTVLVHLTCTTALPSAVFIQVMRGGGSNSNNQRTDVNGNKRKCASRNCRT